MNAPRPPRAAEWVLLRVLGTSIAGRSIVGDAREEYAEARANVGRVRADLWYLGHAASLATTHGWRERLAPGARAFANEVRVAVRTVLRRPASAAPALLVLALGIGISTFTFSLGHSVFLRGMDLPNEANLLAIHRVDRTLPPTQADRLSFASQDVVELRWRLTAFARIGTYWTGTANLSGDAGPVRYQGGFVSAEVLDMLGVEPVLGRTFRAGEDTPGAPRLLVIGHHVWHERYGGSRDVLGRSVRVNGETGTIVGVMPEGFGWPANQDVWITMDDDPSATERWQGRFYGTIGELRPGVSRDEAAADVARVADALAAEYPATNAGQGSRVATLLEATSSPESVVIFLALQVCGLLVLAVACANVANLLLARASARLGDAGLRAALGGTRFRMALPFLAEALVLATGGAGVGIMLTHGALRTFDSATVASVTQRPWYIEFGMSGAALGYAFGLVVVTALVSGLVPALKVAGSDVASTLRDQERGSTSLKIGRLARGFVVVQVAVSFALVVGAGLMTRSMLAYTSHEFPYDGDRILTARVGLFPTVYPERDDRQRFWADLTREVALDPLVESAALASVLPASVAGSTPVQVAGQEPHPAAGPTRMLVAMVGSGFFDAVGAPLVEGRDFTAADLADSEPVAIVNASFARRFWGDRDPIGRTFQWGRAVDSPELTVVGVVPDLMLNGFVPAESPLAASPAGFYVPATQYDPSFLSILVRTPYPAIEFAPYLRAVVAALDPDLPVYDVRSLAEHTRNRSWFYPVFGVAFVILGVASMLMAATGLYAVLSFAVHRRRRELGIRRALGARASRLAGLVGRQLSVPVGLGLMIGFAIAWLGSPALGILLFSVGPHDPVVLTAAVAFLVGVAAASGFVPVMRAVDVDPATAIRAD